MHELAWQNSNLVIRKEEIAYRWKTNIVTIYRKKSIQVTGSKGYHKS